MTTSETIDAQLLASIKRVIKEGDVISTLGNKRPNLVGRIDETGIEITTTHSLETSGGSRLVPAWMFNHAWQRLQEEGQLSRNEADRLAERRKLKRSSIVFAILERLPEVEVSQRRPLVLGITDHRNTAATDAK